MKTHCVSCGKKLHMTEEERRERGNYCRECDTKAEVDSRDIPTIPATQYQLSDEMKKIIREWKRIEGKSFSAKMAAYQLGLPVGAISRIAYPVDKSSRQKVDA